MELTKKQWKTFKISQVLTRVPIKSVSKILKAQVKGTINVVGNSAFNNGVIKKNYHWWSNLYSTR